ncbi:MAG: hypothetical protein ACTSP4_07585 [Candidatus Hodarchaeales archaeon]
MSSSELSQAYSDIKISLHLLKDNWKAFASTEIFALTSLFITMICFWLLLVLLNVINPTFPFLQLFDKQSYGFYRTFMLAGVIVFLAFLTCQYGLAYDIIASGDMFAEFRGSFTYFRHYWLQYTVLTLFCGWVTFLAHNQHDFIETILIGNFTNISIPYSIFHYIMKTLVSYIWFVFFINTLPSITSQGSFKQCFTENFRILREQPKRLFSTWGLFFIIFYFPVMIFNVITFVSTGFMEVRAVLIILTTVLLMIVLLVGMPIMALTATRIYTSADFHNKPVKQAGQQPSINDNKDPV